MLEKIIEANKAVERDMADSRQYKIAVIGKMKSGKSSFIRAYFRYFFGDDAGINPPIDIVECTRVSREYSLPFHEVALWDIPGYGSTSVTEKDYFKLHQLDKYDAYVMCSAVYSDFELALHNEIALQGKRYVYARTKTDMAMRNWMRSQNATDAEWTRERNKIEQSLKTYFHDVPIFFIDNKKPNEFDFPNLVIQLPYIADFSIESRRKKQEHDKKKKKTSKQHSTQRSTHRSTQHSTQPSTNETASSCALM
ncbi:hypothetical protein ScPMuIL_015975 [Solemya velum]